MNRFAWNDARRFNFSQTTFRGFDRTFAIDWVTQTVNNASKQLITDWYVHDRVRTFNNVALFNVLVGPENNNANVVRFKVQGHALDSTREFNHFTSLNTVQTIYTRDTVTDGQNAANFGYFCFLTKVLDLVFQDRRNFCSLDTHLSDLFHYVLEGIELRADRRIDHFRTYFNDKTADERLIHGRIDSHSLTKFRFERFGKLV